MMTTGAVAGVDAIGPEWDAVFEAGPGLQSGRAWFAASEAAAVPAGAVPLYLLLRDGGAPAALVPLLTGPGRRAASFTTPYTCLYQPCLASGADPAAVGAALGRHLRAWPSTVLEAMDAGWPGLPAVIEGLRSAGVAVRRFAQFGNWHLPVPGWSWDQYLASRPGRLRETVRRKAGLVRRRTDTRLEVVAEPAALGAALAAYDHVYARSWKGAEPFPRFNAALVERLLGSGALRIALMWVGAAPVAAQIWTVSGGTATVLKLAHDDAFKPLSPGTVLTAHVIRALLERERVQALDFGRGDDGYKRDWVDLRRQRIGLLVATPWRPAGLWALARHDAGTAARRARMMMAATPENG